MPHTPANYVHHGPWDDNIKLEARYRSIIKLYRKVFKLKSIPKDTQYWTMCGAHYKRNNPIMGELGHMTESGLILPDQFFGVDKEEKVIDLNKSFFPHITWIHGDFLKVMCNHIIDHKFNPSIINYDGVMQPRYGVDYLRKILRTIDNNVPNKLLVVCNFVLKNPYNKNLEFTIDDIINELMKIFWIRDHWTIYPNGFEYKHNKTEMGTVVFIKDTHNVDEINYTKGRDLFWRKD